MASSLSHLGQRVSVLRMTENGTTLYDEFAASYTVPELVTGAIELAKRFDFTYCVHPATGRLLAALAAGMAGGTIGETGTGTGAGVAWMLSTAPATARIVSIELDEDRARAAASLLRHDPRVTILHGEANTLAEHGPFDLLVVDAPAGPGPMHLASFDPISELRPNGTLVKDDLWPMTTWPPTARDGSRDLARERLLDHPDLLSTEIRVAEGFAVLVARRRPQRPG
jgi:predicted O-methyltransferase YrrM